MKTTEKELEAEYQNKLAKLRDENKLRAELPKAFQNDASICHHGKFMSATLWNGFRTDKKLSDALAIVELFPEIITAEHWKSGCVSCWPPEINSCIKDEHATMDGSHEVEISVSGGRGFGPDVTVSFWVRLAGMLTEINLPVGDAWILIPSVRANYNKSGHLSSCDITWPQERAVFDKFRTFWSEKPAFRGSYYFAEKGCFKNWVESVYSRKEKATA